MEKGERWTYDSQVLQINTGRKLDANKGGKKVTAVGNDHRCCHASDHEMLKNLSFATVRTNKSCY